MDRDKFLTEQKILRLATSDGKGNLHLVAVWYDYTKKQFHIGSNTRTKKIRNIMKNPNICILVDAGINAPGIYGVMGVGKAKIITDKTLVTKIAKKILGRYLDIKKKSAQELLDDTDCIIQIKSLKYSTWSY